MRLIVVDGVQYDADNLPKGVDASKGVPAAEWFKKNRNKSPRPAMSVPEADAAGVPKVQPRIEVEGAAESAEEQGEGAEPKSSRRGR